MGPLPLEQQSSEKETESFHYQTSLRSYLLKKAQINDTK